MIRSVGSGGYVSADAFRYRNRSLELIGSVSDFDKQADPVKILRDKLKPPAVDRFQPRS
jgi:PliI/PliC-like inhibitor of I-type lysozyme